MTTQLTSRGATTRTRILSAATAIIEQHGVAGLTIDQVCARATVSKSQLYHFFSSRDALIDAVATSTVESVLNLQAALFAELDSFEGVEAWARALIDLQIERGGEGGCPIGSLHSQLDAKQSVAQRILREGFDQWEEAIAQGLATMKQRGQLPSDCDTDEQARLFLVAIQGGLLLTDAYRDHTWLAQALNERLRILRELVSR